MLTKVSWRRPGTKYYLLRMIKKILLFSLFSLLFSLNEALADFTDIEYSWYRDSILNLQNQWLTNGYGDGRYGVENNITRAEILTLLLRASNIPLPEVSTEKCFPDVDPTMWYHRYICAASALGMANGFDDGKFKPNNPVTTLEAGAFGNKAFSLGINTTSSPWYTELQNTLNINNILTTRSYTLNTLISRGKSAALITWLQEFKRTNSPLSSKSTGCQAGWSPLISWENTLMIAGKERKYNLYIPSGYSNTKEYSLAIATHGRTNSKDQVQKYMGLEKGQSGVIIAYPAWLSSASWKSFSWSEKENMTFIDAILQQVSENYCVDRNKVYIIGHSLGGWMAQRIACLRGEFVSGLAVVGSGPFGSTCSGPVPSLFFQNTNDQLSSYASGISARNTRLKVNECDESQTENVQIGPLTCTKYNKCSAGNEVVWCEGYTGYNSDPHSWPTPNGGRDILEFLRK
jgi:polyhydroxybutyrate depolymerase